MRLFTCLKMEKKLSEFPAEKFIGKGHLIQKNHDFKQIDMDLLMNHNIKEGDIVIVDTGHYKKFGTEEYYKSYPEITMAFANYIIGSGVKILALDFPSPDAFPYEIHKVLFKNEILIIENITNLSELSGYDNFNVIALPAKFEAAGSPVRVIAQIL